MNKSITKIRGSMLVVCLMIAAALVLESPKSLAQEEDEEKSTYVGADFTFASMDALGETYSPVLLRARLGLVVLPDLIPTLSVEGHIGVDITDDSNIINGNEITLRPNNFAGIYARASQQVVDIVTVYGLLGYSAVQMKGDTQFLTSDTETGLSFGAGAMFSLPFNIDGYIEAMQLVGGDAFDIYAFSIGVSYKL